jgi:DNA-directed RNA polymerase subunit M/transcription elongation factor TFIIS
MQLQKAKTIPSTVSWIQKTIRHSPRQMVAIIDKEKYVSLETTVQIECLSCSNNVAYVWKIQTRGADESSAQFMHCTIAVMHFALFFIKRNRAFQ